MSSDPTGSTVPLQTAGRRATELSVSSLAVLVEEGPDRGKSATLTSTSIRVGTDPASELTLTDHTASRRHLMLTLAPEGILAEDLGSSHGTLLNGARITTAFVPDGGLLKLGETCLRVRQSAARFVIVPEPSTLFCGMLGQSRAMRDIFALVKQLAQTDLPVAIAGETGTGKELIGRALHEAGPRRDRKFLVLDCRRLAQDLRCGREHGSISGADSQAKGLLEECAGGTVFLDEIGEIEVAVQPHLLRALETKEICRPGSRTPVAVDFRIVSATNRDLRRACLEGKFRQDLFYRLSCVTIQLPALRERREDIPLIAKHFVEVCAQRHQMSVPELSDEALELIAAHHWPGNVRELHNRMDALTVLSHGTVIKPAQVKQVLSPPDALPPPAPPFHEERYGLTAPGGAKEEE